MYIWLLLDSFSQIKGLLKLGIRLKRQQIRCWFQERVSDDQQKVINVENYQVTAKFYFCKNLHQQINQSI